MDLTGLPLFDSQALSTGIPKDNPSASPAPRKERAALSVTELTRRVRERLEPALQNIWVRGEVSNLRPSASGHLYFSLKDSQACLSAVAFGWMRKKNRAVELKDGMEVLCRGRISVYPPRGTYQLVAETVEPLGAGALQAAFEKLKQRLRAEGLFDSEKKKKLPLYPKTLAVITSPSGAALRDVIQVSTRRAAWMRIVVVPAVVQGDDAASSLIAAMDRVERHCLGEAILLARGGGSLEDLWCFNDERLARRVHSCALPVVSAVGHEIDFTIADFVADVRAPTPSAGAEILTAGWVDVLGRVNDAQARLESRFRACVRAKRELLSRGMGRRLTDATHRQILERGKWVQWAASRLISPRDRLTEQTQRIDELFERLARSVQRVREGKTYDLNRCVAQLDALSPLRVLERGYSIVREPETGKLIKSVEQIGDQQRLKITFHDGDTVVQTIPSQPA